MSRGKSSEISIGELAKKSGHAPSAIRFYESRGLVKSNRSEGGQRRYGAEAVYDLKAITFAQSAGFTLSEIADLHGQLASGQPLFGHWRDLAERKLAELDEVILRAEEMKRRLQQGLNCKCTEPSDCGLLVEDAPCSPPS